MKLVVFLIAFALCGCAGAKSGGSEAAVSTATPDRGETAVSSTKPSGVVAAGDPSISLGANWYPFETYRGEHFRWAGNDAEVTIHNPSQSTVTLTVNLEGGPSLGTTKFPLIVNDAANHRIASADVNGRQDVSLVVPVAQGKDNIVKLHVNGGGKPVHGDPRTLNFRVFSITDKEGGTVAASATPAPHGIVEPRNGVKLGGGWYPLETFKGETFRWVANDAQFEVSAPRDVDTRIRAAVEAGPGLGTRTFTLKLDDASHRQVAAAEAKGRSVVLLPVHLHGGENRFALHVDGGGKPAPNDPRTLNFRVFALSVLR